VQKLQNLLNHLGNPNSFLPPGSSNDKSVIKGQVLDLSLMAVVSNRLTQLKPVKIFMVWSLSIRLCGASLVSEGDDFCHLKRIYSKGEAFISRKKKSYS